MKYRLTSNPDERALFTAHMKAVMAGESWVRLNPGHTFKVKHINIDGEDFNFVAIYNNKGLFSGGLAYEDVS